MMKDYSVLDVDRVVRKMGYDYRKSVELRTCEYKFE
jgi:hypothetical protein